MGGEGEQGQVVSQWEGWGLKVLYPLHSVYGGSDELSDDITQQQLLPGVK